jgi:hypothetical protein
VKVRAVVLGTESNIDKNKRFSFPGTSSNVLFAINESAITGGTKKTVRTIAKADIENIRSFVLDKAKKDAFEKQKKDAHLYILISELTKTAVKTEKLSGEVGEEADKITYTGSGEVIVYRIQNKAIEEQVKKKLENEKPSGYETSAVQFTVKKQKKLESGDVQLTIEGAVEFKKMISSKEIVSAVTGRSKQDVSDIIQSKFSISNISVVVQPSLPLIQDRMPFWGDHIRVELTK